MIETYGPPHADDALLHIVSESRDHPTHNETTIRSYSAAPTAKPARTRARSQR